MKTLGIDPGYAITGFGVIEDDKVIDYGCIRPKNQLITLQKEIQALLLKHKPDAVAVEKLFFSRNVTTALRVGEARGVILFCIEQSGIPLAEYTPLEVKMALTGYGRADKHQVQQMVKAILKLDSIPKPDDAADALAIAVCHLNSYKIKELAR